MKRKKRMGWILSFVVLSVLVGFLVFAYILGKQVAHGFVYQNVGVDTHQKSLEQLEIWGFEVDDIEAKYSKVTDSIETGSGYSIPLTILNHQPEIKQRAVIIIHGLGGDAISTYPVAKPYLEAEFCVVLYDQRASGRSLDNRVTFGYNEKEDLQEVVSWVHESMPIKDLTVHGISMGGTTLGLYLGSLHAGTYVDYAIMESAFHRLDDLFTAIWNSMNTGIPERLAYYTGNLYMRYAFEFRFSDVNVLPSLAQTTVPTMIIHGTNDTLCPPEMAEDMAEVLGDQLAVFWLNDSAHIESVLDEPSIYISYLATFLGDDFETDIESEQKHN